MKCSTENLRLERVIITNFSRLFYLVYIKFLLIFLQLPHRSLINFFKVGKNRKGFFFFFLSHLDQIVDVTRRLGCLANGVADVKAHEFFKETNWKEIMDCKRPGPLVHSSIEHVSTKTQPDIDL